MDTIAADFDGAWKYALEEYLPDFMSLLLSLIHI